jgi:hypothetical protein
VTIEHRNLITLEEIMGVQLECEKCHARISVPISDDRPLPVACPHCDDSWVINKKADLHDRFLTAVTEFRAAARKIIEGPNNVNCTFSLQINSQLREHPE